MLDEKLRGLRLGASELSTMSERGFGDSGLAGWGGLGKDVVTAHHGSGGRGCSCCSGSYGSYGGEGRGCGNRACDVHVFLPRLGKYSICLSAISLYRESSPGLRSYLWFYSP